MKQERIPDCNCCGDLADDGGFFLPPNEKDKIYLCGDCLESAKKETPSNLS